MSADFRSPPAGSTHKCISGGGKWKSADVKQKTVTLIYPDPFFAGKNIFVEYSRLSYFIILCNVAYYKR
jgi:hypothetical protein